MTSPLSPLLDQVLQLCYEEAATLSGPKVIDALNILTRARPAHLTDQQVYDALGKLYQLGRIRVYTLHHGKIRHLVLATND